MGTPTLEIVAFYQAVPATSPVTYNLTYTLTWDHTEVWTGATVVLGWGPEGVFSDAFTPSFGTFTLTADGLATVTRTVVVAQISVNYVPLIQDAGFNDGSPWTLTNASVTGGNLVLSAGGSAAQKVTLQPGTYAITVTPSVGTVGLTVNGFAYTSGTNFTVDDTPIEFVITSTAGATVPAVSISGTPVFPVIVPPTQQEFPQVPASASFPLYVAAVDGNNVVQTALYLTNVAPATGSPQTLTAPVIITPLDNTLTPIPAPALQPSSGLNN